MILQFLLGLAPDLALALPTDFAATSPAAVAAAATPTAEPGDARSSARSTPSSPRPVRSNYWHGHEQGWFWYRDTAPVPVAPPRDSAESPAPAEAASAPLKELHALTERIERSLARAVLDPSPANLQHYMELNATTIAMARDFAAGWQRLLWRSPALDSRLVMPAADPAVQAVNDAHAQRCKMLLQDLARQRGLWFFFRGDCPVCHRFAPVLGNFATRHGFAVIAISLDGSSLPGFPGARVDRQAAARLAVEAVPALYLVAPGSREIVPVGYGYMSAGELGRRLVTLTTEGAP